MTRIPEEELERLKREIDLADLVRAKGVTLEPTARTFSAFAPSTKTPSPLSSSPRRRTCGTAWEPAGQEET